VQGTVVRARDGPYLSMVHQTVLRACPTPDNARCQWHQAGAHPNALPAGFVDVAEMRTCKMLSKSPIEEFIPVYPHGETPPQDVFMCDVFTVSVNHFQSHRRNYFGMLCAEGYFSMVIISHSCCAR